MRKIFSNVNKKLFFVPATLAILVVLSGIFFKEQFEALISFAFNYSEKYMGWFYSLGTFLLMPFCLWAALSKVGNIRLGGEDAKPDMSLFSWIAITFTSGMAMGVVFYGVGEGLTNFMEPPKFTALASGSVEAAESALQYVYVHWGFQAYSIYTAAALGFAFVLWNLKKGFSLSAGLYPLIGEKADGWIGSFVNWLCLYVLVASLGTNVGLGTLQLSSGINFIFNTKLAPGILQIIIIVVLGAISITAACSGIHKGIKFVSDFNMLIFFVLLVGAFVFGGTIFILNNTISSFGKYLDILIPQALYLEPVKKTGWVARNTIYYWSWWITVAPLTGLFLSKLGKGRTIRQFVVVNLLVPVGFIVIWFGTFGSSAILRQLKGIDIWNTVLERGYPVAFFAYLDTLPLNTIFLLLGLLAVFLSFITQSESMIYTIAEMTSLEKNKGRSTNFLKVFWGVMISTMGFVLIHSGGLETVQTSVVMLGVPILIILLINCVSFIKATTKKNP